MLQLPLLTLLINSNVIDWLDETSTDIQAKIVSSIFNFGGWILSTQRKKYQINIDEPQLHEAFETLNAHQTHS